MGTDALEPEECASPNTASASVPHSAAPELIAYVLNPALSMRLVTAESGRAWMDATDARFANRCLPLLIANQSGWLLLSDHTFRATWNGGAGLDALSVEYLAGPQPYPAASHFGHGILTFSLPFLFRTSAGYNLLVRGPANAPKDGIAALEGVVEADWCPATFTVNWQFTRKDQPLLFEQGEPIAMLVPQRRGELESFRPSLRTLDSDPAELSQYQAWSQARAEFLAELRKPGSRAVQQKWQKDYFQGVLPQGTRSAEHQTKLALREFTRLTPPATAPTPGSGSPSGDTREAPSGPEPASAEQLLSDLVVQEHFLADEACVSLLASHRRFASLSATSDNALDLALIKDHDRTGFELATSVIERIRRLIQARWEGAVACESAVLCAFTAGGFRRALYADSVRVVCPQHGAEAEHLVRVGCACRDLRVVPNLTPWRRYSALIWLNDDHLGGEIVLGGGPNVYGRAYRKQFRAERGSLLLSPSNEHYFRHTTGVQSGTAYLLECWFTDDAEHAGAAWRLGSEG